MDIALLIPIEVEYLAFRRHLQNLRKENTNGKHYEIGILKGKYADLQVGLRLNGSKNKEIALETQAMIQTFRPQLLILGGIAGGVKDIH